MTEQQQNILSLFNTKDPVNMEIAEETAISTGNGVWFSNWINKLLLKIYRAIVKVDFLSKHREYYTDRITIKISHKLKIYTTISRFEFSEILLKIYIHGLRREPDSSIIVSYRAATVHFGFGALLDKNKCFLNKMKELNVEVFK